MAGRTPAAGIAETQRLLDDGLVRHVLADVFVARDVPDSQWLRATAAALLAPTRRDQTWIAGFTSAVWLHTGWRDPRPGPGLLEVILPAGRNRTTDPWVRSRQVQLTGTDVMLVHGVAVTDPVRTAADIARELPPDLALTVLRHLAELTEVVPSHVMNRLHAMRYARGAARARAVIETWQNQG
jgi:AbiEi antitoxin C-terminal domain